MLRHGTDDAGEYSEYMMLAAAGRATKRCRAGAGSGRSFRKRAGDLQAPPPPDEATAAEAQTLERALTADSLRAALLAFGLKPGGRAKSVMALRLLRARRAATASEALSTTSSSGKLPPRFDSERAGNMGGSSLEACRLCAGEIMPPRRSFCCDECVHFHLLRTSGSHVRKALALRDQRRCVLCSTDAGIAYAAACKAVRAAASAAAAEPGRDVTEAANAALVAAVEDTPFEGHARLRPAGVRRRGGVRPPKVIEGSFWQVDHVVAVHQGGGCCSMDNLRTLCSRCHAHVTATQAKQRADERRRAGADRGASSANNGGSGVGGDDGDGGAGGSGAALKCPSDDANGIVAEEAGSSAAAAIDLLDDDEDVDDEESSDEDEEDEDEDEDGNVWPHTEASSNVGEVAPGPRSTTSGGVAALSPMGTGSFSGAVAARAEVVCLSSDDGECID